MLVAAGVAVVRQRLRVAHLDRFAVVLHEGELRGVHGVGRARDPLRRDGAEQPLDGDDAVGVRADGPVVAPAHLAHELRHHPEGAGVHDAAAVGDQQPGEQAQDGGLAHPVGADQRRGAALGHPEGHLGQQRPPVRQRPPQLHDVDVAHGRP